MNFCVCLYEYSAILNHKTLSVREVKGHLVGNLTVWLVKTKIRQIKEDKTYVTIFSFVDHYVTAFTTNKSYDFRLRSNGRRILFQINKCPSPLQTL